MTATPSLSNPIDPVSKSQKSRSHKPGQHPLPACPPSEVCLDGGLHSDAQTTSHEPEDLGHTPSRPHAETVDSEDILPGNVCLCAKHRTPGFGSCDLEPAVIAGQHHPQAVDYRNPTQTGDLPITATIDLAILDDRALPGGEQT
ncbi:hypothetical protein HAV15_008751 [Penicillium sp. str. |nr:hypothetical protein HAV15_008751 [Penicillium sp. str. \